MARTPSRTRRLSSARKTLIVESSIGSHFLRTGVRCLGGDPVSSQWWYPHSRMPVGHLASPPASAHDASMRHEAQVISLSWIPSEAVRGIMRGPFDAGFTHYDEPPPDEVRPGTDDLEKLRESDRFRFANVLQAWIDVEDGGIVGSGFSGGGLMGSTTVRVPGVGHTFEAVGLPDLQRDPEVIDDGAAIRFVQTCGGRTGLPAPRRVRRKPFVQWRAPLVWSTLALTIRADGTSSFEVIGASRFPRHWIYGPDGALSAKSGLTDFKDWYRRSFGTHTPWG